MHGRLLQGALICSLLGFLPSPLRCQAIPLARRVAGQAPSGSSLSFSVTPSLVDFALLSKGVSMGSSPVQMTLSWGQNSCRFGCKVRTYAYFANPTAALSGGGTPTWNIPSADVYGQVPGGFPTTYSPFVQSNPITGSLGSLLLFEQKTHGRFGAARSNTFQLYLEINLANQPQLPAGSYTGVLFIQAETF